MDSSEIIKTQEAHKDELIAKKNVTGVGIGYRYKNGKRTDEVCLVVMVKAKEEISALAAEDVIPAELDGVCTDVQVREVVPMQARTDKWRPAPGGVSCGHKDVTAGTIGFPCLQGESKVIAVSNNHVIANEDQCAIGDSIWQPGKYDGGSEADRIGKLLDFEPVHTGGRVIMDAGIFAFDKDSDARFDILEIGPVPSEMREAALGMKCQKSGRTTGLTKVVVTVVNATVKVSYSGGVVELQDQIIADRDEGEQYAIQGGDSGSALLDTGGHLVGLCFAGAYDGSYLVANRIQPIAERFNLNLDVGEQPPPPGCSCVPYAIGVKFARDKKRVTPLCRMWRWFRKRLGS